MGVKPGRCDMWAQLIKMRIREGKEAEVRQLPKEFESGEMGEGRWVRMIALENQSDPREFYTLVIFESEAAARENEQSPQQAKRLERIQQLFEGPREFVDLNVVHDSSR
jgi:quinol monooxygenase YgiN